MVRLGLRWIDKANTLRTFQQERGPVNGCDRAARPAPDQPFVEEAIQQATDVPTAQACSFLQVDDTVFRVELGKHPPCRQLPGVVCMWEFSDPDNWRFHLPRNGLGVPVQVM